MYTQEACFLRNNDFLEIKSVKIIKIENSTFWEIVPTLKNNFEI